MYGSADLMLFNIYPVIKDTYKGKMTNQRH
jgi:hypothetical protein